MGTGVGARKTLCDHYGMEYERTAAWLLLFDRNFAELLLNNGVIAVASAFERAEHATIAETATGLYNGRGAPGYIAVISTLTKQRNRAGENSAARAQCDAALAVCDELRALPTPDAQTIAYVTSTTELFLKRGRVRAALIHSVDLWEREDYDGVLREVEQAVRPSAMGGEDLGLRYNAPVEKLQLYQQRTASLRAAPVDIPLIEQAMRGGIEPGGLGLIMAPSGRGKSLFLVQASAAALTRGLHVALASCELGRLDYALRMDAHFSGVPINELARDPKAHAKTMAKTSLQLKGQLRIRHWGSNQATVGDLNSWIKLLDARQRFKPDVILMDYADLLRTASRRGDRPDIGETIRALRQMATDYDCAVWTASQVRRSSYNATILRLDDVAEDIQKVDASDVVLALCQTPMEKARGLMRVALLKNRQGGGEGMVVDCFVYSETMLLTQTPNQARMLATHGRGGSAP